MDALPLRQSFLPTGVDLCYFDIRKSDNQISLNQFNVEKCGFDYSGKYFVMFSDERQGYVEEEDRFYFDSERFINAVVLTYDQEKQNIDSSLIKIRINYPSPRIDWHLDMIEYDAPFTNWFIFNDLVQRDGDLPFGITKEITIYHGCLRPYLGTSKVIEIDSQSNAKTVKLMYSNLEVRVHDRETTLWDSKTHGSLENSTQCLISVLKASQFVFDGIMHLSNNPLSITTRLSHL